MNSVLERNRNANRRFDLDVVRTSKKPLRKHVSYNSYEGYLDDIEIKLQKFYRCGYSALHKKLVREKAEQISDKNFWTN